MLNEMDAAQVTLGELGEQPGAETSPVASHAPGDYFTEYVLTELELELLPNNGESYSFVRTWLKLRKKRNSF